MIHQLLSMPYLSNITIHWEIFHHFMYHCKRKKMCLTKLWHVFFSDFNFVFIERDLLGLFRSIFFSYLPVTVLHCLTTESAQRHASLGNFITVWASECTETHPDSLLCTWAVWCSLFPPGCKSVQDVTVLNPGDNYNTIVSICISKRL